MTLTAMLRFIGGTQSVQMLPDIGVAESPESKLATHHHCQKTDGIIACRVQIAITAGSCLRSPTDRLNLLFELTGIRHSSQRFQITSVGRHANF